MSDIQNKWDERYREAVGNYPEPALVLEQNQHLLPKHGHALDFACGLGANALLLAKLGLQTQAWDISGEALTKVAVEAKRRQLDVLTEQRDVSAAPPAKNSFDVIVVSHFLDRALCAQLVDALNLTVWCFIRPFVATKWKTKARKILNFYWLIMNCCVYLLVSKSERIVKRICWETLPKAGVIRPC